MQKDTDIKALTLSEWRNKSKTIHSFKAGDSVVGIGYAHDTKITGLKGVVLSKSRNNYDVRFYTKGYMYGVNKINIRLEKDVNLLN